MSRLFIELYLDEDVDVLINDIAQRRPPAELVNRLLVILNNVTADEMTNQIRYI